jgi:glycogen(starch) synthase
MTYHDIKAASNNCLRIFWAIGPGDVVSSYLNWKSGQDTISETSVTFSSHLFEFCRKHGVNAWAVSSHWRQALVDDGQYIVENRPNVLKASTSGARYHLNEITYAFKLLVSALRYKPDVVIVDSGTTHWFLLSLFRLIRMKVVPNLHNSYWAIGNRSSSTLKRVIERADGWFFRSIAAASLGVSPECERQVRTLAGTGVPFFQYRAQFRADEFLTLPLPDYDQRPLHIAFVGRVERNKGVYDIIDMAELLQKRRPGAVVFDLCGTGAAFSDVANEVSRRNLARVIKLHGYLNRPQLLSIYLASHVSIVPTRSDFCEGLPMTCAQAVLCQRPVITSRLSNALDVLHGAIIEARPEAIDDYVRCIELLLDSRETYEQAVAACKTVRGQFIDPSKGLEAALSNVMVYLQLRPPTPQ